MIYLVLDIILSYFSKIPTFFFLINILLIKKQELSKLIIIGLIIDILILNTYFLNTIILIFIVSTYLLRFLRRMIQINSTGLILCRNIFINETTDHRILRKRYFHSSQAILPTIFSEHLRMIFEIMFVIGTNCPIF